MRDHKRYDEDLSFGNYIAKQIYQQIVAWGGLLGGTWAGLLAAKHGMKAQASELMELPFLRKVPGLEGGLSSKHLYWGGIGGMLAGTTVAGLILGYGHWKKEKVAQMQVDEITRDISDIEMFKKTDPELKAENKRLWAQLKEKEKNSGMVEKTGAAPKANWKEEVTAQAESAQEPARA